MPECEVSGGEFTLSDMKTRQLSTEQVKRRGRRSRAQWLSEVQSWRRSGQSCAEYAQAHGLHEGTLAGWASRLRHEVKRESGSERDSHPAFLAVHVSETPVRPRAGSFEVVLANGRCVRIAGDFDVDSVSRLLAAVEGGTR